MTLAIGRPPPPEILDLQAEMESHARDYGLDFFDTIFEMVDYEEMCMFAAYGGFPVRYPHWRFGAEFDELRKGASYGLQKIYEMVINTDPCYAYLLSSNSRMDQKLVIAHVYGHCDFFKNNAWFAHTNRRMLDEMANHATRVSRHIDRYGYETVEKFIDACLSLEDLIDPHSRHIVREAPAKRFPVEESNPDDERDATEPTRFRSKSYMDAFINPPEVLEAEHRRLERERRDKLERRSFPEQPQRDVLRFLLEHAPLQPWQRDILAIVRDEAYYFAPQGQTKIMNEGWASYWHSKIMTRHGLTDDELIDYADHHSGTMATSPGRLNPYKLGIELFKDIEDRWNKGKFGPEYDACTDTRERARWDTGLGAGRQKIFEVRRVHNDVTFIDAFLTPEFCVEQKLFRFQHNDIANQYEIVSREFGAIKAQLLDSLTNHGRPFIHVVDGNHRNRGELLLSHLDQGVELRQDYARDVLINLEHLWSRPVAIETHVDGQGVLLAWDGATFETR